MGCNFQYFALSNVDGYMFRVQTTFGNTNALKYVKTLIMRAATYRNIFKN